MGKVCKRCPGEQDLSAFRKLKSSPDGHRGTCKRCSNADLLVWRKNNPEKLNKINNKKKYKLRRFGISLENYNQMLISQDNKCAICGSLPDKKSLAVDHNHDTGFVRGLLCLRCNTGLGYFKDNSTFLLKAAAYLQMEKQ